MAANVAAKSPAKDGAAATPLPIAFPAIFTAVVSIDGSGTGFNMAMEMLDRVWKWAITPVQSKHHSIEKISIKLSFSLGYSKWMALHGAANLAPTGKNCRSAAF